jgi:hypothetical protein
VEYRFSEKIMLKQQSRPGIADCRRIVNRQRRQAAAAIWPASQPSMARLRVRPQ